MRSIRYRRGGYPSLGSATGDQNLIDHVEPLVRAAGVGDRLSVVHLRDRVRRDAHFGAEPDTVYEIGSVTKTMTSLLLADALDSGLLRADTTVGSLLDLDGSDAAVVTLEELASHRSGLPRIASNVKDRISATAAVIRHRNPYTVDLPGLLVQAKSAKVVARGKFSYSNLGAAILGHAVAAHRAATYPDLLHRHLFSPLGMRHSSIPLVTGDLPQDAPTGWDARGRAEQPWTMGAYAPAGGVRSTPDDMARYAQALLDDAVPGAAALTPRWDAGGHGRVGYAWFTSRVDGFDVTWHNGATGGFASMLALDRLCAAAVAVLANTAIALDDITISLLLDAAHGR